MQDSTSGYVLISYVTGRPTIQVPLRGVRFLNESSGACGLSGDTVNTTCAAMYYNRVQSQFFYYFYYNWN